MLATRRSCVASFATIAVPFTAVALEAGPCTLLVVGEVGCTRVGRPLVAVTVLKSTALGASGGGRMTNSDGIGDRSVREGIDEAVGTFLSDGIQLL